MGGPRRLQFRREAGVLVDMVRSQVKVNALDMVIDKRASSARSTLARHRPVAVVEHEG